MSSEESEALVRRYIDLGNQHDIDAQYDMVSADCIFHMVFGDLDVIKGRQFDDMFALEFPDLNSEIVELIAQRDLVSCRVIIRGTNLGTVPSGPATGKKIELHRSWWLRIAEGKIAEYWGFSDRLTFFQQLGVTPPSTT